MTEEDISKSKLKKSMRTCSDKTDKNKQEILKKKCKETLKKKEIMDKSIPKRKKIPCKKFKKVKKKDEDRYSIHSFDSEVCLAGKCVGTKSLTFEL